MARYIETDTSSDGIKIFTQLLFDKFEQFVCHISHCRNVNQALKFLLGLPFVSGSSIDNISCPKNIYMNIVPFVSEVCVLIGGQLTTNQNHAVRHLAENMGVKTESMCSADDGSSIQRQYLEAMARLQEKGEKSQKKGVSRTRRWWLFLFGKKVCSTCNRIAAKDVVPGKHWCSWCGEEVH